MKNRKTKSEGEIRPGVNVVVKLPEPNEADAQMFASGAGSRGVAPREILLKSAEPNLAGLSPERVQAIITANCSSVIRLKTDTQR